MDSETQRRGPGRPPKPRTDATAELLAQLEAVPPVPVIVPDPDPVVPAGSTPVTDNPLADAPRDGRAVLLLGSNLPVKAYWRETRAFANGSWQTRSFWAHWRGPDPVMFEPTGWAEAEA